MNRKGRRQEMSLNSCTTSLSVFVKCFICFNFLGSFLCFPFASVWSKLCSSSSSPRWHSSFVYLCCASAKKCVFFFSFFFRNHTPHYLFYRGKAAVQSLLFSAVMLVEVFKHRFLMSVHSMFLCISPLFSTFLPHEVVLASFLRICVPIVVVDCRRAF